MNDFMKTLLAVFLVGLVFFGTKSLITSSNTNNVDFTPSNRITAIERKTFMDACTGEGGDAGYCRCALDHLEANNTPDEIRAMDRTVTPDYMPPEMWDAVYACQHLQIN